MVFSRCPDRRLMLMADLDFSSRYCGPVEDEIGELGISINRLSGHLEKTISALRETNLQLEEEIDKARRLDEMRRNLLINVSPVSYTHLDVYKRPGAVIHTIAGNTALWTFPAPTPFWRIRRRKRWRGISCACPTPTPWSWCCLLYTSRCV